MPPCAPTCPYVLPMCCFVHLYNLLHPYLRHTCPYMCLTYPICTSNGLMHLYVPLCAPYMPYLPYMLLCTPMCLLCTPMCPLHAHYTSLNDPTCPYVSPTCSYVSHLCPCVPPCMFHTHQYISIYVHLTQIVIGLWSPPQVFVSSFLQCNHFLTKNIRRYKST